MKEDSGRSTAIIVAGSPVLSRSERDQMAYKRHIYRHTYTTHKNKKARGGFRREKAKERETTSCHFCGGVSLIPALRDALKVPNQAP